MAPAIFVLAFLLTAFATPLQAQCLDVSDLKCDNLYQPLGLDNTSPHFSWKNHATRHNARQTAYQLQVGTDSTLLVCGRANLWKTSKVRSSESVMVPYQGKVLSPGTLCFWRVRTWDETGHPSAWSPISRFSIGLLSPASFPGRFIGLSQEAGDITTPIFKTIVTLRGSSKVMAHVCSLGYHELYVNGTKVGTAVLTPAVSQLDKRAHIVTYDITPYTHAGTNDVEIWASRGWYRENTFHARYGGPVVKACFTEQHGIRWQTVACTDSSWTGAPSGYHDTGTWYPLQFGGEHIDGCILTTTSHKWFPVTIVDPGNLIATPQMAEPNRIISTLSPKTISRQSDGSWLIDFGRVITGWLSLDLKAPARGQTMSIAYADFLVDSLGFKSQGEHDEYVAAGKPREHFQNKFHHHAFRYVSLQGLPSLNPDDIKALQLSGDYREAATFSCSDSDLNAIYDMISRTMRCLTFSGYMVDCPHLERMGYGGDGNSSTLTVQALCDVAPTFYNWLTAWGDAMGPDGDLPYVAPAGGGGGGPYWSAFIIKAPWRTYINYGDKRMICQLYDKMKQWLGFVRSHMKEGLLRPWPDTPRRMWFLGDWLAPMGVDVNEASVLLTNNCVVSDCLQTMERIARTTGNTADADSFATERLALNKTIQHTFFHPADSTYATGSPLDMSYPLLTGVVPHGLKTAVEQKLTALAYGRYRGHIATGLVGTAVFTQWATQAGSAQLVYDVLKKRDYPGYLYMIDHGATTTWEYWSGERSHVHNCYNGIGTWFIQALGGLMPDETQPGYRHVTIAPQKPRGISWVNVSKETPYGTLVSRWNGDILHVEIPVGISATVVWNGLKHYVGSGSWTF